MPRKKTADPETEDPEDSTEPGEQLPPIEDLVKKLSGRFANEITIPDDPETDSAEA
jgi:hypothetical protein